MKSYMAKPQDIEHKWYVVDAADRPLGRIASEVAKVLRGKHKPTFTPHMDTGDFVIILNADKVKLTGKKWQNKKYYHHSGYPGGLKETTYDKLRAKSPEMILQLAIKGMLPKNTLGRAQLKKLKIYAGAEHPHQAQQPEELKINI